jgi:hypothetical protein
VRRFLASAAEAWVSGAGVEWAGVVPGASSRVDLPTYAFQRERFWLESGVVAGGVGGVVDPAGVAFWAAVEGGDLAGLASALGVEGDASFGEVLPAMASWRRGRREVSVVDEWRYGVAWRPVLSGASGSLSGSLTGALSGTWLVVGSEGAGAVGGDVVEAVRAGGARVVEITVDTAVCDRRVFADGLAGALRDVGAVPAGGGAWGGGG